MAGVITLFDIPSVNSGPIGIAAGPDGAMWFVENGTGKVGRITMTGEFTEFDAPGENDLHSIIAGPDGALWYTDRAPNKLGRITTTGNFLEIDIPTPGSLPAIIKTGPDGALWFAEYAGNQIGRYLP